ncbi:MAG: hypothetical protein IMZ43_09755 [Thermoplasmata archaeon]|nr:hypothetical protein [Thermoplasmata archaeon]
MSRIEISGGSSKEALEYENLDHLALTACADIADPVDMTAEVADNTVLANILANDGNTSDYDRSTDSLEAISDRTIAILADTAALRVLTEEGGTLTGTNAEQNLYINNAPAGIYIPAGIFVDFDNMAADDIAEIRIYYRIKTGGGLQPFEYYALTAADGGLTNGLKGVYYPLKYNRFGIKVTLVQTQATTSYKTYDYEVFYKV